MKKAFLFLSAILLFVKTQATVIYTEAFESDLATVGWTNSNLSSPWGNSLFGNFWYNDDMESGLSPGTCGNAMLGDQSVYIGPFIGIFTGAAYDASSQSNVRISSPAISTVGYTNLVLSFNFIGNGDGNTDKGYLQYSTDGGTTWVNATGAPTSANPALLSGSTMNNLKSDNGTCAPQGRWTNVTWNLPAACNNISNLKIAFVWQNNNDNIGTDPSFAFDDVLITGSNGSIATTALSTNSYCAGASISVPFTCSGTYTSGNVFTAQLSSSTGSFASPTAIGTLTSTAAGTIAATIPSGTSAGNAYRIRVVSSTPNITGSDNGTNIIINRPPNISASTGPQTVCSGDSVAFSVSGSGAGLTFQWQQNGSSISNGGNISGATSSLLVINPANATNSGTYTVVVSGTCPPSSSSAPALLTVNTPSATFSPSNPEYCEGGSANITATGATGYSWQPSTGLSSTNSASTVASPTNTTTYTVTLTTGSCSTDTSITVTVNALPDVVLSAFNPDTVCKSEAPFNLTGGSPAGGTYTIDGVAATSFDPAVAGLGSHEIIYSYSDLNNCAGSDTQTVVVKNCTTTGLSKVSTNNLHIYPNPSSGTIFIEAENGQAMSCRIVNLLGSVIWQGRVEKRTQLQLEKGMYFLQSESPADKPIRIIIQ